MKAVRVKKRGKGDRYTCHWLVDDGRTFCGLATADLQIDHTFEAETLHPVEACGGCVRTHAGWTPDAPGSRGFLHDIKVTAEPAAGRVRKTGPLMHGSRSRRGGRTR